MNETKHAQGKWNVSGDGDHVWVEPADKDANVICDMIGRLYDRDAGTTQLTDEDIANAHLIAARPDLLTACQLAKQLLTEYGDSCCIGGGIDLRIVLGEAIAKAKGESI